MKMYDVNDDDACDTKILIQGTLRMQSYAASTKIGRRRRTFWNVWKRRHVILTEAGSFTMHKTREKKKQEMSIGSDIPWFAFPIVVENEKKDCLFGIEIPLGYSETLSPDEEEEDAGLALLSQSSGASSMSLTDEETSDWSEDESVLSHDENSDSDNIVIYFRCDGKSHVKDMWLKVLDSCGKLSAEPRVLPYKKNALFRALTTPMRLKKKPNNAKAVASKNTSRLHLGGIEVSDTDPSDVDYTNEDLLDFQGTASMANKTDKREHHVLPICRYPSRCMSRSEMKDEMLLPSEHIHDLRARDCAHKEVGSLKVEVLQCFGLPKVDKVYDANAMVYLVCGSYAFSTDAIPDRSNPMWLRETRRSCDFPLFHGYAQLFAAVFDCKSARIKDNFIGRIVLDLARLRSGRTYDVTIPLRQSAHVYSREKCGAVRLRLTLKWTTERDALMSYLPKKIPSRSKRTIHASVKCADEKSFRSIALTVHGKHLPGSFSVEQLRETIRELELLIKGVCQTVKNNFTDTIN
jgi:hypothetical protein